MAKIEFIDGAPPQHARVGEPIDNDVFGVLLERPDQWAVIESYADDETASKKQKSGRASKRATQYRHGAHNYTQRFEFVAREGKVFGRHSTKEVDPRVTG